MYCCQPLKNKIADAGERGSAILVERTEDGFAFWLQSRGVAHRDEEALRGAPPLDVVINLVSSQRISHCPYCGQGLEELAGWAPEAFADLAAAHRPLLPANP